MGKAKQKRIKKEIEKLFQTGRYWDWFALVENEGVGSSYTKEWQEAWKIVARRAFRLSENLQDFWNNIEKIENYPDSPDLRLLFLLRDFVDGKEVKEDLSALEGLSPQAEPLRGKALSWQEGFFSENKLKKVLAAFADLPGKVNRKSYSALAQLTKGADLAVPVDILGQEIDDLRNLNSKKTTGRALNQTHLRKLEALDSNLKTISRQVLHPFFQILVAPFVYQFTQLLQTLSRNGQMTAAIEVVSFAPFLFSLAAGERLEEIRDHLSRFYPKLLSENDGAPGRENSKASLEEKAALLGKMRSVVKTKAREEFLERFNSLYKDLLSDIAGQREKLSEREKREMTRVMGTFLVQDIDFLWDCIPDNEGIRSLADILIRISRAGCLEVKLSLLSLIVADMLRNKLLREHAESALKDLPSTGKEDVWWILNQYEFLIFPHVSLLKPVIARLDPRESFMPEIAERILDEFEGCMFVNTLATKFKDAHLFKEVWGRKSEKGLAEKELATLRKEIGILNDCEPFSILTEYVGCYPEGVFTEKAYRCFLEMMYRKGGGIDGILCILEDVLNRLYNVRQGAREYPTAPLFESFFEDKRRILFAFLKEYPDALKTIKLERVEKLIDLLTQEKFNEDIGSLLIALSNILGERAKSGEKEAGNLNAKLMDLLIKSKRKKGRPPRK